MQRDQPISLFQKIVIKYISWFVLGMGYLILWQYEVDAALHMRGAWQGLLALWALAMVWMAVRALRQSVALSSDYDEPIAMVTARKEIETADAKFGKP